MEANTNFGSYVAVGLLVYKLNQREVSSQLSRFHNDSSHTHHGRVRIPPNNHARRYVSMTTNLRNSQRVICMLNATCKF